MNRSCCLTAAAVIAALAGTIAIAQPAKDAKPGAMKPAATQPAKDSHNHTHDKADKSGMPAMPPGMTEEDMKDMHACMEAGTPGPMHAYLAKGVGTWAGKQTMWMKPGAEPMKMECTSTATSFMDGRFVKCEMAGDIPGMGPFNGFAIYGYDNVGKKFQCTWVDNCGTGMMVGTGELSSDQKTMTWNFNYNCPVTKKAEVMREVERVTAPDTKTLEMYMNDPKTGKEYKMMEIAFTRKAGSAPAPASVNVPTGGR